jgi:hypothetical protein
VRNRSLSKRAAATECGKRLPGDSDVNRDRLYRKLRDRWDELEAELGQEEGRIATMEERAELLASELAGVNPAIKRDILFRRLQIIIENAEIAREVADDLREQGLDLSDEFLTHIDSITVKITEKELAALEASPIGRYLRRAVQKSAKS